MLNQNIRVWHDHWLAQSNTNSLMACSLAPPHLFHIACLVGFLNKELQSEARTKSNYCCFHIVCSNLEHIIPDLNIMERKGCFIVIYMLMSSELTTTAILTIETCYRKTTIRLFCFLSTEVYLTGATVFLSVHVSVVWSLPKVWFFPRACRSELS